MATIEFAPDAVAEARDTLTMRASEEYSGDEFDVFIEEVAPFYFDGDPTDWRDILNAFDNCFEGFYDSYSAWGESIAESIIGDDASNSIISNNLDFAGVAFDWERDTDYESYECGPWVIVFNIANI